MTKFSKFSPTIAFLLASLVVPLCLMLQQIPGLFALGGIKPILLIPAVIAHTALARNPAISAALGLVFGMTWDIFSGQPLGYFGIYLLIIAAIISQYHQDHPVTVGGFMLQTTAVTAILCCIDLFIFGYMLGYGGVGITFSAHTLPTILYTGLFSPAVFGLVKLALSIKIKGADES